MVRDQADTLAFIDAYWMLAGSAFVLFCLTFMLKRNDQPATRRSVSH